MEHLVVYRLERSVFHIHVFQRLPHRQPLQQVRQLDVPRGPRGVATLDVERLREDLHNRYWVATYGGHGPELILTFFTHLDSLPPEHAGSTMVHAPTYRRSNGFFEDDQWGDGPKLVAFKVIGDPNVPSGRYTFVSSLQHGVTHNRTHNSFPDAHGAYCLPPQASRIHLDSIQYAVGQKFESSAHWDQMTLSFSADPTGCRRFSKTWMGFTSHFTPFELMECDGHVYDVQ